MVFPVDGCPGVPIGNHPGAFGAVRKYDIHTGIDLYCSYKSFVYSLEKCEIIDIWNFTGPEANSPWWLPTKALLTRGPSGYILYGEIEPKHVIMKREFTELSPGEYLGFVECVLPKEKIRADISGHNNYMLHIEMYEERPNEPAIWNLGEQKPYNLLDPTKFLLSFGMNKL